MKVLFSRDEDRAALKNFMGEALALKV